MKANDSTRSLPLLVVDDAPEIRALIGAVLEDAGYKDVTFASCAREALDAFEQRAFAFALLDVMLPDTDGFTLARIMRQSEPNLPLMFLTAKDRPEDRVSGLVIGADDYLVKPFLTQELLLRISAILRRCYPADSLSHTLVLESCEIDLDNAEVHRSDGTTVTLTAKEKALIDVLSANAGRIVTMDCLKEALWGPASFGYENSLMTHVRRLREKIERDPSKPRSLVTAKGIGYRLNTKG